jgi:hypothetical protein
MNGLDPSTVLTAFAGIILGPAGISFIVIACAITWILAGAHFIPPRSGWISIGCGFGAFTIAFIIRQVLGGGA